MIKIIKSVGSIYLFCQIVFLSFFFALAASQPSVQIDKIDVAVDPENRGGANLGRVDPFLVEITTSGIDDPKIIVKYELYVNGKRYYTWGRNADWKEGEEKFSFSTDGPRFSVPKDALGFADKDHNYPSGSFVLKLYYDHGLLSTVKSVSSKPYRFTFDRDWYLRARKQKSEEQASILLNPQVSTVEEAVAWWRDNCKWAFGVGGLDLMKKMPIDQLALIIKGGWQILSEPKYSKENLLKNYKIRYDKLEGEEDAGLCDQSVVEASDLLAKVLDGLIDAYKSRRGLSYRLHEKDEARVLVFSLIGTRAKSALAQGVDDETGATETDDQDILNIEGELERWGEGKRNAEEEARTGIPPAGPGSTGGGNLRGLANQYYNRAVTIAFPLAVIVLIYGGYLYITSTGNPEALGEAKGLITGAIIGLILLLLAGLLVRTVGFQTPVT